MKLIIAVVRALKLDQVRDSLTATEALGQRLCLLVPHMQNRHIIDRIAAAAGIGAFASVVRGNLVALWTHVAHGPGSSLIPDSLPAMFLGSEAVRAVPLTNPSHVEATGLVVGEREPRPRMVGALLGVPAAVDFPSALDGWSQRAASLS